MLSSVDCITTTSESEFSVHTRDDPSRRRARCIPADLKAHAPDQIAVSKCRIASIDPNHAMILPHDAEHARRMGWMCDRVVEAGEWPHA
jgi:hypothetical protein